MLGDGGQNKMKEVENEGSQKKSKLTIAIVSPGIFSVPPVIGSSVEHDIEMVSRVMQEDHHVIVYTRTCSKYPVSSQEGNLKYKRFRYRNAKKYLEQVLEDIKKRKPEIIQVENRPHFVPLIKKKLPKTPVILNMHSMQFASQPWISAKKAQRAMRQIDALLTNSQFLRDQYIKKFPSLEGKAYGVHLGIDLFPYLQAQLEKHKVDKWREKFHIQNEDKVLLFVGRIKRDKGTHHLIKAFPKVVKKEKRVKLLIVGSPRYGNVKPTPYLKSLQAKARKFKRNVEFTKFINPSQMPYIYQLADVVVTPSVWEEPFCRVNLEAMSSAKPIVTTKRGGIPEVVIHGEDGYVLSLRDISNSLPNVLIKLLESEEMRERFGLDGLRRAALFSWKKTAENYLFVYQRILKGK